MALLRCTALLLAAFAAGCAFRRGDPLPADPPADFVVAIFARDASGWPWDGRACFGREGSLEYDVVFKDPPSNRRGAEPLDEAARAAAWAAVGGAGFFDRVPVPWNRADGPVIVDGRALGLDGRWSGDPATDPDLAALLDALRRAAPPRVFRPLPADEAPR